MATVETRRSKRQAVEASTPEPRKQRRRFRWGRWFLLSLILTLAYAAPAIVAVTPLGPWLLPRLVAIDGSIQFESASLGWFAPVSVEHLAIVDSEGHALVEIESLSTEKTLVALVLDMGDLGLVHVDNPVVHLAFDETSSNLERALAPLWKGSSRGVTAQLQLTGGNLVIDDLPTSRQFHIDDLAIVAQSNDLETGIAIALSGALPGQRQPGNFKIDLQLKGSAESPLAHGKIDCQANAVPLELVQPLVRRFVERASIEGQFSSRLSGAWGDQGDGSPGVQGESLVTNLVLSAEPFLAERIQLDRVEFPCKLTQNGDSIQIEQLAVQSELGSAALSGTINLSQITAEHPLAALARQNYDLKGHVELAQLAQMFQRSFGVRQDAEITGGQLTLSMTSREQDQAMVWSGTIDASGLAGRAGGRALSWDHPLAIQFAAHEKAGQFMVDSFECDSEFLEIEASGSIEDLSAKANFDIGKLAAQLKQFVDTSRLDLGGQGHAELVCKRSGDEGFAANGELQAFGFRYATPDGRAWTEDKVVAQFTADGQLKDHALRRVEHADLTIDIGGERMEARLREPIDEPRSSTWPLALTWTGQLAHWALRLESCLGIAGWELAGVGTVQGVLGCSAQAIAIEELKADFTQFELSGHGWFVNEPGISLALEGKLDLAQQRVDVAQARLTAAAGAATVNQAVLRKDGAAWRVDAATAELEGDLTQLSRWRRDPRVPAAFNLAGRLASRAELKLEEGVVSAQVDGTIDEFRFTSLKQSPAGGAPFVSQPQNVRLAAIGKYRYAIAQLDFDKLQIASDTSRCDASGTVAFTPDGGKVDIKGTVQYDWEHLAPLWQPYLGSAVQVAGNETRTFSLHGPWVGDPTQGQAWKQVTGEAAIGWAGMSVYGLQVAPGEVVAHVADGQATFNAIDIAVNEGRLTVSPQVRLTPPPSELLLAGGPLLTDVHLSPELCAKAVKFVAPILADTTVADGRFSISLDGGWLPMANPSAGDVSGRMAIRAQARPGPIAEQFLVLVKEVGNVLRKGVLAGVDDQTGAVLSVDDSNIEFRMVGGRVYHRGLQFQVGTVPISTYGSVGLDESLAIMAEIPLKATLFGRDLSFGALEGRVVQIPIDGTLEQPKIDSRAMAQLTGKMLQNTARGVLIDGVGKTLERLLPGQGKENP